MRDLQGKKKIRRLFQSNFFAVFLAVISLFLIRSVWDVYKKNVVARMNAAEAKKKLDVIQTKKNELQKGISNLKTEKGIEEELRRRFQVIKPGEQVLVIVDKDGDKEVAPLPKEELWYEVVWKEILAAVSF